jgi:hypothetical protein
LRVRTFGSSCFDKDQVKTVNTRDPHYSISGLAKDISGLCCKACKNITPIKSNSGIYEEKERFETFIHIQSDWVKKS